MSERPVAGTFRLDGMLQGPVPDAAAVEDMESWAESAKKSGLHFHLSIDGPNFSIVPDPSPLRTSRLAKPDLEDLLTDALDAFLSLLPIERRTAAFSTIRSEEFRPGRAVQTLFAVGADGRINSEQRIVDIDTEEPVPEVTAASIKRAILPALVFLLLALFVSSFFIDYRRLWSEAEDSFSKLDKEKVTIEQATLAEYVTLELTETDNKKKLLLFKVSRGPKWDSAFSSTPANTENWNDFVNRLAIQQGRLRVELRNKEGQLLSEGELNVLPLRKEKSIDLVMPGRFKARFSSLTKVVVRP